MLKLIMSGVLFLFYQLAYAQESPIAKSGDISLGIYISPGLHNQHHFGNNGTAISNDVAEALNESKGVKFSFSGGMIIRQKVKKNMELEAGLGYSNKGSRTVVDELFYGDMVDPRYGFTYDPVTAGNGKPLRFKYNYIYLDIPVRVLLHFGERKTGLIAGAGITTNIFITASQKYISEKKSGKKERKSTAIDGNINPVNFSPTLSFGMSYKLNSNISICAEPVIKYGLLKISDTPVSSRMWSAEIMVSGVYRIK